MQRSFAIFVSWLAALAALLIAGLGFGLRSVFNMDSDLMFVALPLSVAAFSVAVLFVSMRLYRSALRLFVLARPTPSTPSE